MVEIGQRAKRARESGTFCVIAKARKLKQEGRDVISFSAGEPDFPTPENVCRAAEDALRKGYTKYTPAPGIPELQQAVARKFQRDYGFTIGPEQVVASCGAKHSIYLALCALIDPGDEVLIPSPFWVSYPEQVRLLDGQPVIVETTKEEGFKLTPERLRQALTSRSRVLILNSPSNPTGAVYTRAELEALSSVVIESNLAVICDDIYEKLVYDGVPFVSFSQVSDAARAQSIVINGVSKCASMTGWRLGYMVAPKEVARAVKLLQGQMTSHPTSIAQWAALEAIDGPQETANGWVEEFRRRRDAMVERLNRISGVSCPTPKGAFYAFSDWRERIGTVIGGRKIESDLDLSDFLLETAWVATVPGVEFGAPGFLRLSFATSIERVIEGMDRIRRAVEGG